MKIIGKISINLFLFLLMLCCILPFWMAFTMSTLPNGTLFISLPMLPGREFLVNLEELFSRINIMRNFMNSVIVSVSSTVMNLFFSALAAYAFSKHRFRFKEALFLFAVFTMFIPTNLTFVGYVQQMSAWGLMNTLWPLIIPSLGSGLVIFIVRGYIAESVPDSLVESAKMDGCFDFMIFIRIVLPLIKPVLAAVGILLFMGSWNEFARPLVILVHSRNFTLPLAVASLQGIFSANYSVISVGVLISTFPILIAYAFLSRLFIEALTSGAVKG